MKVQLTGGKEWAVSLVAQQSETQLCIGFTGIISYDVLREELTPEALAVIKYYQDDTENYVTYEDYTDFVTSTVVEAEAGTLDVAMYFKKVDATTKALREAQQMISVINKQVNPTIDIKTCTLVELKAWQINQSKKNLETYLESNPIKSSARGETQKYYSITREKQSLLTQMILVTQLAIQSGVEYQPSWNAAGEACTYDWKIEELQQLAFEIEAVVRPLVSHQQTMEAELNASETKEAVMAISITF